MQHPCLNWLLLAILFSGFWISGLAAAQEKAASLPPAAQRPIDFKRDIEPLLKERCQSCHGATQQMGGLRLDSRAGVFAGGYSGAALNPGDSSASRLIQLVAGLRKDLVMPMAGERLTAEQVGLLRAWIDQGASWPDSSSSQTTSSSTEVLRSTKLHWAFVLPRRPDLPQLQARSWTRNPIDAFVLARLEKEGINPSPEADRTTLIRRASLDLLGLPPSPEEVTAFVNDSRLDAYERLIDRLLASQHYGERWARQWLDLARYADSDGFEKDNVRPDAWKWRQWVIDALNRNLPFDQFTIEQIAGDLLPNATVEQKIATGFHRNTLTNREGGVNREEYRIEQVIDRASTVGTVWLGLTAGCARCHDHKYDPISQKEFYQLFAFFNSADELNIEAPSPAELGVYLQRRPEYEKKRQALLSEYKVARLQPDWERKMLEAAARPGVDPLYDVSWDIFGLYVDGGQEMMKIDSSRRTQKWNDKITDFFIGNYSRVVNQKTMKKMRFKELNEKLSQLKSEFPALSEAQTLAERPGSRRSHVLIRGDYRQPGIQVQPGTPAVLNPLPADLKTTRLALARWLVSKDNPLTARVAVNRAWQEFFGRGLVETSQDFGTRAEPPSHPELLDWLATEFMASGWNMKQMHRLIATSATYRQSSQARIDLRDRDPENRLLARQSRLRLGAEFIRDSTLAVSGLLNPAVGGPSVRPPLPPGVLSHGFGGASKWKESAGADRYRRGLYVLFLRTTPYPQLVNFDAPDSMLPCSRRERSTTPLQALNLLNDRVFFEAAQVLAARILRDSPGDLSDRLAHAFRLCLARQPSASERSRLTQYFEEQKTILERNPQLAETLFPAKELDGISPSEAAVWVGISRLLLNLEEFITRG